MSLERLVWDIAIRVVHIRSIHAEGHVHGATRLGGTAHGGQTIFGATCGDGTGAHTRCPRFEFVVEVLVCVGAQIATGSKLGAATSTNPGVLLVQISWEPGALAIPKLSVRIAA